MADHEIQRHDSSTADLRKYRSVGVIMAVIGFIGMFLAGLAHRDLMFGSYMFGLMFWMSITFGCLGLLLLHHAVRASWSFSILRLLEAGSSWQMLLLMLLLFVPVVLFGMPALYEWARQAVVEADPIIRGKAAYLNTTFWTIRLVGYFLIWMAFAAYLRRSTVQQDENLNFRLEAMRSSVGAAGMVVFTLTATFAAIDWIMSMDPHWYSTMYGAWVVISAAYAALAFCTAILCANANKEPYRSIISRKLTTDLGNMLFVCTMLWGYTTLSQFLIIWNGGIPETTEYYAQRSSMYPPGMQQNFWALIGFILIVGMFFIPFYSLLAPRMKSNPGNLKKVAMWMFFIAIINMHLIVAPSLPGRAQMGPFTVMSISDLLALVGVGGIWISAFGAIASRVTLVPRFDTRLQEAAKNAH
jgi:hypothetical protein